MIEVELSEMLKYIMNFSAAEYIALFRRVDMLAAHLLCKIHSAIIKKMRYNVRK